MRPARCKLQRRRSADDRPDSNGGLPATPLSLYPETGGFASPPCDGFALARHDRDRPCGTAADVRSIRYTVKRAAARRPNVSIRRRCDLATALPSI
jgi:hypothetical protein